MGIWGRWNDPHDSKCDPMLYDKNQSYWNRPQRSTKVTVVCGTENKLTFAAKPNKWEHLLQLITPSTYREMSSVEDKVYDEL